MKSIPRWTLRLCLLVPLLVNQPLRPSVFTDIANHIKQHKAEVDTRIGDAVGVKLGGIVETATLPALDNAANKFSEVAKGAADRIDQSLEKENRSIDEIAQQNLARLDTLAETRLDQTGELIDERLLRVERDADGILSREESIIDSALKQENLIANQSLDRLQTISTTSLDRVQSIEGDAFNRIDSALQDEVPLAASQVAHEFVIAALVVLLIVALFAFAGIGLWKNMRSAASDNDSTLDGIKVGLTNFWRTLPRQIVTVVIPTLLIGGAILLGYEAYVRSTRMMRISRLEKAATLLESAGEYGLAAELQRRVAVIDTSEDATKSFQYQADLWLSDFTQLHSVQQSDLAARLASLENSQAAHLNGDLQASAIYLGAIVEGQLDSAAAARYRQTFLQGKSATQVPFLGKLVLMAQIQASLDGAGSAASRVEAARKDTEELLKLYPQYGNGHLLAAMLTSMQADGFVSGSKLDATREAALRKDASDELAKATALDPVRVRIAQLSSLNLPVELIQDLVERRKDAAVTARLAEVASSEIEPAARSILTSNVLTRMAGSRIMLRSMRRAIGEKKIARTLATLRTQPGNASLMLDSAQQLYDVDSFIAAESWLESAKETLSSNKQVDPNLVARIESLSNTLAQLKISQALPAVM